MPLQKGRCWSFSGLCRDSTTPIDTFTKDEVSQTIQAAFPLKRSLCTAQAAEAGN
ncbi:hypothetical protein [Leptolyngbya sp. FACHB-711]|uniref:hypothetical protein n=1 Tax=Leptolyngbya sp. FACHB-711 TaxID=2692813 RepID=UPI001683A697|nr:hypothetical protein [Leptolyngbya sp. FACHB-711]MBD2024948.1 hypothetical protein [Leptolyngbya sp. FACHB-711]